MRSPLWYLVAVSSRQLRADAARNRQALVSAAREVMAEHGLDAPLDEIARRAGVGNATLYRRFPQRITLIEAVFADRMAEHVSAVEEALEEPDAWRAFERYISDVTALQVHDRGIADLVTMDVSNAPEIEQLRARALRGSRRSSNTRRLPVRFGATARGKTCSSCSMRMRALSNGRTGPHVRHPSDSCTCSSTGSAPTPPPPVHSHPHLAACGQQSASAVGASAWRPSGRAVEDRDIRRRVKGVHVAHGSIWVVRRAPPPRVQAPARAARRDPPLHRCSSAQPIGGVPCWRQATSCPATCTRTVRLCQLREPPEFARRWVDRNNKTPPSRIEFGSSLQRPLRLRTSCPTHAARKALQLERLKAVGRWALGTSRPPSPPEPSIRIDAGCIWLRSTETASS